MLKGMETIFQINNGILWPVTLSTLCSMYVWTLSQNSFRYILKLKMWSHFCHLKPALDPPEWNWHLIVVKSSLKTQNRDRWGLSYVALFNSASHSPLTRHPALQRVTGSWLCRDAKKYFSDAQIQICPIGREGSNQPLCCCLSAEQLISSRPQSQGREEAGNPSPSQPRPETQLAQSLPNTAWNPIAKL